jgi:Tfp pilus assembly protein PilF
MPGVNMVPNTTPHYSFRQWILTNATALLFCTNAFPQEPLYKAALDVLPKQSQESIAAATSLGEMFVHLGRYADARELLNDVLERAEARFGADHLSLAYVCEKVRVLCLWF